MVGGECGGGALISMVEADIIKTGTRGGEDQVCNVGRHQESLK